MNVNQRVEILKDWTSNPISHGPDIEKMNELDKYLKDEWLIQFFNDYDAWLKSGYSIMGRKKMDQLVNHLNLLSAYHYMINDMSCNREFIEPNILRMLPMDDWLNPNKETLDRVHSKLYDVAGALPSLGYLHSNKRSVILDLLAVADSIVKELEVCGDVLDLGCNAGYHAVWLASHYPKLNIIGVDKCDNALNTGQSKSARLQNLSLIKGDIGSAFPSRKWDLILDFDCLNYQSKETFSSSLECLSDNGVMITTVRSLNSDSEMIDIMKSRSCSLSFHEVAGGYCINEYKKDDYSATSLSIIHKDEGLSLSDPNSFQMDRFWANHFCDFANSEFVDNSTKTQYFCKAMLRK